MQAHMIHALTLSVYDCSRIARKGGLAFKWPADALHETELKLTPSVVAKGLKPAKEKYKVCLPFGLKARTQGEEAFFDCAVVDGVSEHYGHEVGAALAPEPEALVHIGGLPMDEEEEEEYEFLADLVPTDEGVAVPAEKEKEFIEKEKAIGASRRLGVVGHGFAALGTGICIACKELGRSRAVQLVPAGAFKFFYRTAPSQIERSLHAACAKDTIFKCDRICTPAHIAASAAYLNSLNPAAFDPPVAEAILDARAAFEARISSGSSSSGSAPAAGPS